MIGHEIGIGNQRLAIVVSENGKMKNQNFKNFPTIHFPTPISRNVGEGFNWSL
jgi:hypothetical protein